MMIVNAKKNRFRGFDVVILYEDPTNSEFRTAENLSVIGAEKAKIFASLFLKIIVNEKEFSNVLRWYDYEKGGQIATYNSKETVVYGLDNATEEQVSKFIELVKEAAGEEKVDVLKNGEFIKIAGFSDF